MACIVQTERESFFESILDSLDHQVAVIDSAGEIIHVNAAMSSCGGLYPTIPRRFLVL